MDVDVPSREGDQQGGAMAETIYLCNFRVSVDGEWLCLRELADMTTSSPTTPKLQSPAEEDEGIS